MTDSSNEGVIQPVPSGQLEVAGKEEPNVFDAGVAFDPSKVEARQGELDNIFTRKTRKPEQAVQAVNDFFAKVCDDDFGASYLDLSGRFLRGLSFHGIAQKIAVSSSDLSGADLEKADLTAGVLTASVLDGVKGKGMVLDDAILTLVSAREGADFSGVTAVDSMWNLANVEANFRGSLMANAFLLGTQGLTPANVQEIADLTHARALIQPSGPADAVTLLQAALAARFGDVETTDMLSALEPARIVQGPNAGNRLLGMKRLEASLFINVVLAASRNARADLTGSILSRVEGRALTWPGLKAAGAVMLGSNLAGADLDHGWIPGAFVAACNLKDLLLRNGNAGGAVFYETDASGAEVDGTNFDGAVFIGNPKLAPRLSEAVRERVRLVELKDLPPAVATNIERIGKLAAGALGGNSAKELE